VADPDDELDRLYELPAEEFTAARNALAKTRPEVKSLKRPSQAAWIVNQLARRRRGDIEGLVAAGRQLRQAQARGADMTAALREEREALNALVAEATKLGARTDTIESRVRETLQAAAADDEAAARVLEGRLEKELDAPGFAPLLAAAAAAGPAPKRPEAKEQPRRRDRAAERRAQQRVRDAETALRQAEREEGQARREWERAQKAVERARAALEDLGGRT
jgi:hypothetical protein